MNGSSTVNLPGVFSFLAVQLTPMLFLGTYLYGIKICVDSTTSFPLETLLTQSDEMSTLSSSFLLFNEQVLGYHSNKVFVYVFDRHDVDRTLTRERRSGKRDR